MLPPLEYTDTTGRRRYEQSKVDKGKRFKQNKVNFMYNDPYGNATYYKTKKWDNYRFYDNISSNSCPYNY